MKSENIQIDYLIYDVYIVYICCRDMRHTSESCTTPQSIKCTKGELFGEFDLGSTIVLVLEAPKHSFRFLVEPGQRVLCGQGLAKIENYGMAKDGSK